MSTRADRKARALRRNCMNCGKKGPHYVGPSFGDPGFYMCDPESMPIDTNERTNP